MDRTDEPGLVNYPTSCSLDPGFRCEETSCFPLMGATLPFACGDGQCIVQYDQCSNNRHQYLQYPPIVLPWEGMTVDCFRAMVCLTGMSSSFEACPCKQTSDSSCASIAETKCSARPFFFPATPVMFNHVYFIYQTTHIDRSKEFIEPIGVCFNRSFCSVMDTSWYNISDRTCIDYKKEFGVTILFDTRYYERIQIVLKRIMAACPSPVIQCPDPSLYQCLHSAKCISIARIFDGVIECPLGDDELYIESRSLNHTNIYYFKCDDGVYVSPLRLNDGTPSCANGEDEMNPNQRYLRNNIVFQFICDGIQQMLPIDINGRNETDETECEQWKCNNSYTHCDSMWDCPKGEDELECENVSVVCPPFHHTCIEPNTMELICLSIAKVNDGKMDCLGGSDERQLCRSMYPMLYERRYHCWNRSQCAFVESIDFCSTERDKKLSSMISSGYQWSGYQCHSKNLTPLQKHICSLSDVRNFTFLERNVSYMGSKPESGHTTRRIATQSHFLDKVQNVEVDDTICHRGVVIFVRTRNGVVEKCLCPPSTYGNRCEFQNQRISLTVGARSASDWRSIFTFIFMLMSDQNEIESHDYRLYSPSTDCALKWNIYLLYGSRPKNTSKNYSVRIYVYKLHATSVEYRASWHYPIAFSFLPVYRLTVQLTIPSRSVATSEDLCSLDCNGHESCLIANRKTEKKEFLCRCEPGWSGFQCQYAQYPSAVCSCAPGSLCISSFPTSICVCPLGRSGARCYIKLDLCEGSDECLNGGQCIPNDERIHSPSTKKCACPNDFHGEYCQLPLKKFVLTFHPTIHIPSLVYFHVIQRTELSHHQRLTLFKKILPYENLVDIRTTVSKFDLAFTEFNNNYYLMFPERNSLNETIIHVYPENRCRPIKELFNSSFVQLHLIRRIKYYHIPCEKNVDLSCFYDEVHMCLCNHERQAVCISFDHNMRYICQDDSGNCENGGQCFQDDSKCPSISICRCSDCFHGSRCQFSTKGFSLSLDNILGYQIHPGSNLRNQLTVVKFRLAVVIVIFSLGILNGVLSLMAFIGKKSRKVGSDFYLLVNSHVSILTIILFASKFAFLLLAQMTYITNKKFLLVQCISVDFALRTCVNYGYWLNVCVAMERAITVTQGIHFDKDKSKIIAKMMVVLLFIVIAATNVHDPMFRHLMTDEDEQRTWCIVRYSSFTDTYNFVLQILHFSLPFILNIISTSIIIINIARTRSRAQKQTLKKHIWEQLVFNKHLLIPSIIFVLLAIPRLIISIISGCMKSDRDPWIPLIGYFVSFIPPLLIFVAFVLPSKTYKTEFKRRLKNLYHRFRRQN